MTPQEALAQALRAIDPPMSPDDFQAEADAAAILDALPDDGHGNRWVLTEEWRLYDCDEVAQQERERLRAEVLALPKWGRRSVPGGFHVNRAAVLALLADPEDDR